MKITLTCLVIGALACTAFAQQPAASAMAQPDVCRVFFTTPKPGAEQQFEAGRKQHNQFHQKANDKWTWNTWVTATGKSAGSYITASCGHSWADFDTVEKNLPGDTADAAAAMGPHTAQSSNSFYVVRGDLGLNYDPKQPPAPMVEVTVFQLKPSADPRAFANSVRRIRDVLQKASYPRSSVWLQLVNGGEGPLFVLLVNRKNWADFALPGGKTPRDATEEAIGKQQSDTLFRGITDAVEEVYTETSVYRPDLSYSPGAAAR